MSRFINFISEEQIGNKMIFRATSLKRSPSGRAQIVFYLKPNGQYFRWNGYMSQVGGSITKDNMTQEEVDKEIKAMKVVEKYYKFEDFR